MSLPTLPARTSSIGRKVMRLVLTTTIAALTVAGIALLLYEARTYRETWLADLTTQAEILARSSAPALAFEDPQTAEANLALLRLRPDVTAAVIYRPNGEVFASYFRESNTPLPRGLPAAGGSRVSGGNLMVAKPIVENNEALGTVYLSARYELWARVRDYLLILGVVTLASLAVALTVSSRLQSVVTRPIVALTGAAQKVINERDFSARVQKTTDDEVGVLVDAFNAMLAEVGERSDALREADRRKDEFLATLAHELRNPLAPMVNALALLRRTGTNPQVADRAHGMMDRQLAQMIRLVDDLLDVARITTGKLTVQREPAELAPIIRSAIETARPLVDSRKQQLDVQITETPIVLDADATRLAQVFSNLLNNAAKYTDDGGRISIVATAEGGMAVVRIADNGIGISNEVLPTIFDMFAQADHSLERKQSGLGVGLTLARRLVELHGGSINVESAGLGQGSTFTVRLPMRTEGSASDEVADAASARPASKSVPLRILLVDDNADFASSLAALLHTLGHDVRVANDARGALDIASAFAPQFAFLDIGLPEVNGYQLATQLRQAPATAHTVLVAISGWGQAKDRERSQEAGFARHLVKPVEFEQIQAILSEPLPPR